MISQAGAALRHKLWLKTQFINSLRQPTLRPLTTNNSYGGVLGEIINPRKTLTKKRLLEDCQTQIRRAQFFGVPKFLRENVRKEVVDSVLELTKDLPSAEPTLSTPYLRPPDLETFSDPSHPRNTKIESRCQVLTSDMLPTDFPLLRLYNDPEWRDVIEILAGKRLHDCHKPSEVRIKIFKPGDYEGWHFEENFCQLTFALTCSENQDEHAEVEIFPYMRMKNQNYEEVKKVLSGELEAGYSCLFANGGLIGFCGRECLHRLVEVKGDVTVILAVLAYNDSAFVYEDVKAEGDEYPFIDRMLTDK